MSALAIPFVIAEVLLLANAVLWLANGHAWIACGWIAAMPATYYLQKWVLE